jgi:hypothetical protein
MVDSCVNNLHYDDALLAVRGAGAQSITLEEMLKTPNIPEKQCQITMFKGWQSNYWKKAMTPAPTQAKPKAGTDSRGDNHG